MQGAEERRLRRMSNTPQGGAIEGSAADDALMVDQGGLTLHFDNARACDMCGDVCTLDLLSFL
jgi:hypothetical protein